MPKDSEETRNSSYHSVSQIYAADTTVREVAEGTKILWALYTSNITDFTLWDCTFNPPRNITDWPLKEYPELHGPKSKTLHDAGCFPSGTWVALPKTMDPHTFSTADYDDVQYNNRKEQHEKPNQPTNTVQFQDKVLSSSKPLPSQVMESVTKRFEKEDENKDAEAERARIIRRQNQEQRLKIQKDRAARLDKRIEMLEELSSEKNKAVSDQVRRMLVKSRATGDKRLKMQDRIYFQCMLDDGDEITKEFRYFSPQDTFAKIASSFSVKGGFKNSEVLIQRGKHGVAPSVYRRFPVALRVYEAISNKYLTSDQVDVLIIRWYKDGEDVTPTILEDESSSDENILPSVEDVEMKDVVSFSAGEELTGSAEDAQPENNLLQDRQLAEAIQSMDAANNKGKKPKKQSAATLKVRNMQIKSKAKGDTKRIPKVENRFFLEVVMIDSAGRATSSYQFLAKSDPIDRLLQNVSSKTTPGDWNFLVPNENTFETISDTSLALEEAEKKGILNCFDRIVLRRSKN